MRLLGFEISRTKASPQGALVPVPGSRGGGWWSILEPFTGAWQRNISQSTESVLTYHAVYSCVTLIAADIAKMRLRLVERDKHGIWTEVDIPAFSPVLRKQNAYQNRIAFVEQWIISKLLHGNAYVLKERDSRGVVVRLYVLDPTRVRPLVAPDGAVYYRLSKDNLSGAEDGEIVPASEIIHDVMVPLFHPLVGVSPLTACGVAAVQGLAIQRASSKFFQNSAVPSGVLTAPGSIAQETADRLKEAWEQRYSGDNAGKVAVLGDGLKFESMAMKATDAQMIEQLKWSAETVCSAFHVPPYMAGVGAMPTYNNIEALSQQYYSQCLQILIESIELCLDEGLGLDAKKDGKVYGTEFDLDDLLRMDTATSVKTFGEATQRGMTVNEFRRKLNLPPMEGGDVPYLQEQMWPLAQLKDRPTPGSAGSDAPLSLPRPNEGEPAADDDADAEKLIASFTRKALAHAA